MADYQSTWPRLSLMRHAEADLAPVGASDLERPLTGRGHDAALRLGKRLAAERLVPDQILASDAERTLMTARAFLAGANARRPVCLLPDLYDSPAETILEVVAASADPLAGHVLVLAHNPGIAQAAEYLAAAGNRIGPAIPDFPPGACAMFAVQQDGWASLTPGKVRLERVLLAADYAKGG